MAKSVGTGAGDTTLATRIATFIDLRVLTWCEVALGPGPYGDYGTIRGTAIGQEPVYCHHHPIYPHRANVWLLRGTWRLLTSTKHLVATMCVHHWVTMNENHTASDGSTPPKIEAGQPEPAADPVREHDGLEDLHERQDHQRQCAYPDDRLEDLQQAHAQAPLTPARWLRTLWGRCHPLLGTCSPAL
jgi:hypothetical protein